MSKPEAMVRFGIASATPLKKWCRLYREGGAQALKPKRRLKGSGAGAVPPTREEELEKRVRKLEAQANPPTNEQDTPASSKDAPPPTGNKPLPNSPPPTPTASPPTSNPQTQKN